MSSLLTSFNPFRFKFLRPVIYLVIVNMYHIMLVLPAILSVWLSPSSVLLVIWNSASSGEDIEFGPSLPLLEDGLSESSLPSDPSSYDSSSADRGRKSRDLVVPSSGWGRPSLSDGQVGLVSGTLSQGLTICELPVTFPLPLAIVLLALVADPDDCFTSPVAFFGL